MIALSHLPIADWGRADPASLARDGYIGNAVAYRCVRMIAEAAASIGFTASDERVETLLIEPSPDEAGQALLAAAAIGLTGMAACAPALAQAQVEASITQSVDYETSGDFVRNIIPASGEFVYATSVVRERRFPGIERTLNMNNAHGEADFSVSLRQLQTDLPRVDHAALTVGWFGDDVRAGSCSVRPGVERRERTTVPYNWKVDRADRDGAHLISQSEAGPYYGGTPADGAVVEGLKALKAAGIGVTLSPFLMMDVPPGNGLSDPYGRMEQAPFPWRGRITVSADGSRHAALLVKSVRGGAGAGLGLGWSTLA